MSDLLNRLKKLAKQANIELTDVQAQKLTAYVAMLDKWNKAYNLTSVRDPQQMLIRHILDSIVVSQYLEGNNFIDVGTGPGLPGIPLAIMRPDHHFVLLDSLGKRVRFMKQVQHELALHNIEPVQYRVEEYQVEKPFDGVNGSGKHNNWSVVTNTGVNLFNPGQNPSENLPFLAALACTIKAVDEYADLLRMTTATAGNDHRLGVNEAPPAIISMFLGEDLDKLIHAIIEGEELENNDKARFQTGVSVVPDFSKDNTDRNRTSPFAFTGNKFEFRMPGSSSSIAGCNIVLNTVIADELKEFAEKVDAPVCDTLMGKGAFNGTDERYSGMLGMHGTKASNLGVSHCDLLIAVGTRFSDRVLGNPKTFAKNAKILQIDVDPVEINKNICVSASIIGDVKAVLTVINRRLEAQEHKEWLDTVKEYKEKYPLTYDKGRLTCPEIMEAIYDITKGEAVITTEVGQHQMWAAQFYKYDKPRKFLTSGGLGTMGFGVPAAIGAKIANPDKEVILFVGDGGFQMTNQELAILNIYKVPIKVVMLNNHSLGMVRQWQESFYEGRTSESVFDTLPDFQLMAQAYGIKSYKFDNPETIDQDLEVIKEDVPMFIEVDISRKEHVLPIVPAGKSNHEMLGVKFNA